VDRREIEHSCEIVIDGPPDHVFALLSDLERYLARWANGPTAVRKLTGGAYRGRHSFRGDGPGRRDACPVTV
jgi:uncharacterized protein YndB with AHSA1/START domain